MVRMDWSEYDSDNDVFDLSEIRITEMNWEGAPSGLFWISLKDNQNTEMNWEGAPSGLKKIDLEYNQITEINWEGVPEDVEIFPYYLNDLKNKYIKSMKYIKSKAKLLRPITHRIKHLSLVNPKNNRYKVVKKYCGKEFREIMKEALGFDLVH